MTSPRICPAWVGRFLLTAGVAVTVGLATGAAPSDAQEQPRRLSAAHLHRLRTGGAPALTVHRRSYEPLSFPGPLIDEDIDEEPGFLRAWNDPHLYDWGGWRLGGDSFYGDQAGDPITRGNASLGMISGYGPANGGYGGPHFDSVGGFHNGPGPGAQEAADYASGHIWRPDYADGEMPRTVSLKARVAALDRGVVRAPDAARVTRIADRGGAEAESRRAIAAFEAPPPPREDDGFPDLSAPDGDF